METNGQGLQPDLFGSAPHEVDFAVVLCGLTTIKGLGRQGITAITDAVHGFLPDIWHLEPEVLATALAKARVPQAQAVLDRITDRDALIAAGTTLCESLLAQDIHVLGHLDLPRPLRLIPSPPRWLFVQGKPEALHRAPMVAIVGTRDATDSGLAATRRIVELIAGYPITIVSGLAEGIDDEAHRTSLASRLGNVAFLGHGIDIVFPQATKNTRSRILKQDGAVATEYLPGEMYQKSHFVQRNRLQAGLADLVIAVEAQAKSGTAHTVDFALKYKKPVVGVVLPGSSLTETIRTANQTVVDLTTARGSKNLDAILQQLVARTGARPEPFQSNVTKLKRDLRIRNMTPLGLKALAAELLSVVMEEHARVVKENQEKLL